MKGYIEFWIPYYAMTKNQMFFLHNMKNQFDFKIRVTTHEDIFFHVVSYDSDKYDDIVSYVFNTIKIDKKYVFFNYDIFGFIDVDIDNLNLKIKREKKLKNISNEQTSN